MKEENPEMANGAKVVIALGVFTIFSAVMSHQVLHLPAMWGMMFGLSLLKLYDYRLKKKHGKGFDVFTSMAKIENKLTFSNIYNIESLKHLSVSSLLLCIGSK